MADIDDVTLAHHDSSAAATQLTELTKAYVDAYSVEPDSHKADAFMARAKKQLDRPGFELVTAQSGDVLVGFAFGYTLKANDTYWWGGVQPEPTADFMLETGARTFVLSEIEIRRAWQNKGLGRLTHDELLRNRHEERATLATSADAAVQSTYEGWGWQKVGRIPGEDGDYYSTYDLFVLRLGSVER